MSSFCIKRRPFVPLDVALHAGGNANVTQTSAAAAPAFLGSTTEHRTRTKVDLTSFTQCRILVNTRGTQGSSGTEVNARYALNDETTAASFSDIGVSKIAALIDTANKITDSGWVNITPAAQADVYIAAIVSGGNGQLSPLIGSCHIQFR